MNYATAKASIEDMIKGITEEGFEDTAAWEYRADLQRALKRLEAGEEPNKVMGDL